MNNFCTQFSGVTIVTALAAERKILAARESRFTRQLEGRKTILNRPLKEITILQSGMGCTAAGKTALRGVDGIILGNIGLSGGLAPGLLPGTVILADSIYTRCHRSAFTQAIYQPDTRLVEMLESVLKEQGIEYRRGRILCVDDPLLTPTDKAQAHDCTGALAVDMESAGVADAALRAGQLFFCLRVVCDPAKRGLERELFQGVDARGNSRLLYLIAAVCRRPALLGGLLRMAGDFSQAAAGMRRTWDAIRQPLVDLALVESAARPKNGHGQCL